MPSQSLRASEPQSLRTQCLVCSGSGVKAPGSLPAVLDTGLVPA